jgi:DNA-binding response OmpR family regulator
MKTVLVVGRDWQFRALLRAQLREDGYEALGLATLEEAAQTIAQMPSTPAVVVFDTTGAPASECLGRLQDLARRAAVIVVASAREEVDVPGAQVLHRPLSVGLVVTEVKRVVEFTP